MKNASEYDQEIPQSRITDQTMASWERTIQQQQSEDTRKTDKVKETTLFSTSRWLKN